MAMLREAADHRKPLWIGYVDADGGTTHRMIEPVAMSSGAVVAYDRLRGAVRTFVLHRITGVRPVSDDELADAARTRTGSRTGSRAVRDPTSRADLLAYCLGKPGAWVDEPWEGDQVVKVADKIFAFLGSDDGQHHRAQVRAVGGRGQGMAGSVPR